MLEKHLSFTVSGGAFVYQMGIAWYIQQHFDLSTIHTFTGSSGGSWPAFLLSCDISVKKAFETMIEDAPKCCEGRLLGAYGVYDVGMRLVYEKIFSKMNVPEMVKDKLGISVTRLAWYGSIPYLKDEVITSFESNEDIIQCIIASALIPFALNGSPVVNYRGWTCIDAGVTNCNATRRFEDISKSNLDSAKFLVNNMWCKLRDSFIDTSNDEDKDAIEKIEEDTDNSNNEMHVNNNHNQFVKETDEAHFPTPLNAIYNQAKHLTEYAIASAPYGILGLTKRTTKALVTEMKGELVDRLNQLETIFKSLISNEPNKQEQYFDSSSSKSKTGSLPNHLQQLPGGGTRLMIALMEPDVQREALMPAMSAALVQYFSIFRDVREMYDNLYTKISDKLVGTSSSLDVTELPLNAIKYVYDVQYNIAKSVASTALAIARSPFDMVSYASSSVLSLSPSVVITTCVSPFASASPINETVEVGDKLISDKNQDEDENKEFISNCNHSNTTYTNDNGTHDNDNHTPHQIHGNCHILDVESAEEEEAGDNEKNELGLCLGLDMQATYEINDNNNINNIDYFYTKNEKSCDDVDTHHVIDGVYESEEDESRLHSDILREKIKEFTGGLWRERDEQPQLTSSGALRFEISPWIWRNHPLIHYHLSSSQEGMRDLFDLGMKDARAHHHQFEKFFT